jgi:hypothetical protein
MARKRLASLNERRRGNRRLGFGARESAPRPEPGPDVTPPA